MPSPPAFPRDRLSLCMIVKDEADRLARCLTSAAPWVGEVVVVDTGSTDGTVAIAQAFGARVLQVPWADDFAAARNASLDAATRPWALVLDADEALEVLDPAAFAAALTGDGPAGYLLELVDETPAGPAEPVGVLRLLDRTRPGMRYRGCVHEQVAAVADRQAPAATLPGLRIRHDGYLPAVVAAKGKAVRNARLARKLVAERPEDPHAWYVLGGALGPDEAAERRAAFERALDLAAGRPDLAEEAYVRHVHLRLARDAYEAGDREGAVAAAERGLAAFPRYPDLLAIRAADLLARGDLTGAAADLLACLAPVRDAFVREMPAAEIEGVALAGLDHVLTGLLAAGRFDDVEALLSRAPAVLAPAAWQALRRRWARTLAEGGFTEVALHLLLQARADAPDDADLHYWIGRCALAGGQPEDARVMWEACLALDPAHALARRSLDMLR